MKNLSFLILILFTSCTSITDNPTKSAELKAFETSIDSLFHAHIGDNEPGAAVLIAYDGKMIIGKGYGLRDLESK